MRCLAPHHLAALGLAALSFSLAQPAHCEEVTRGFGDRHLVIEGVAGLGTPVGTVGVMARVEPLPWLSVGGGVGRTFDGETTYAAMALFRLLARRAPRQSSALTLDTGYSAGGSYTIDPNPTCWIEDCSHDWTHVVHHIPDAQWVHLARTHPPLPRPMRLLG